MNARDSSIPLSLKECRLSASHLIVVDVRLGGDPTRVGGLLHQWLKLMRQWRATCLQGITSLRPFAGVPLFLYERAMLELPAACRTDVFARVQGVAHSLRNWLRSSGQFS